MVLVGVVLKGSPGGITFDGCIKSIQFVVFGQGDNIGTTSSNLYGCVCYYRIVISN